MRKKISYMVAAIVAAVSCTANFEELNKPGENITDEELSRDNFKIQSYVMQMIENVLSPQENSFQMNENLIGDVYGRYMMTTQDSWNMLDFSTYNAPDNWINYPFDDVMEKFTTPWFQVKEYTEEEGAIWAWTKILRVAAMHRLGDMYGALPYSKVNSDDIEVAYDSLDSLYHYMIDDLTSAVEELTLILSSSSDAVLAEADEVYAGDMSKWVRLANSLKLRLAMRLSGVEPEYAQQMAEEAVNQTYGVITSNSDNPSYPYESNSPVWKMCVNWGDSRAAADIVSYMSGYEDPRLSLYFDPVTFSSASGDTYAGIRSGAQSVNKSTSMQYSCPVADMDDEYCWMTAAEVAFLKAEGALYGWNMGGSTAESLYEEGITLSFEQWGASGASSYIESENTPADYTDPAGTYSTDAVSTIPVKWSTEGEEANLEQIITQKWIAMFPLGQEAWSEYRRTGYPKFFTLPVTTNYSTLTTVAARIPFNRDEYTNNSSNINSSTVQELLGGSDDYDTKVYWAK